VWAQAELRKVLTTAGARVVEAEVAVGHAPSKFGEAGELVDEEIVEQLSEAIDVLTAESAPVRPVALAV
jgi:NAD(P)H-dependent FMN reductase